MSLLPLVIGLAACSGSGPTCTCVPGRPLASRADVTATVAAFAAVFEGTVVRTAYRNRALDRRSDGSNIRLTELEVTVAVNRRWKGEAADTVTVRTPAATEACGADFIEGRSYLVFAGTPDYSGLDVARPARAHEVVYTTKCSPSTSLGREVQRIAALLGPPLPPRSASGRRIAPDA